MPDLRPYVRPLATLLLLGCFAGCASGSSVSPGDSQDAGDAAPGDVDGSGDVSLLDADGSDDDGASDDATGDANPADTQVDAEVSTPGGFGDDCESDDDCASRYCIEGFEGDLICTEFCAGECEDENYECRLVANSGGDVVEICYPLYDDLCRECEFDRQCSGLSNQCVELIDGSFCAIDCSTDGLCPAGFECADIEGSDAQQCLPVTRLCTGCFDPDGDFHGEGPACVGLDCDEGNPENYEGASEVCDGEDNNCNNAIDEGFDLENDPENCGACNNACAFDNAVPGCFERECFVLSCEAGFQNLDGVAENGCEYVCVPDGTGVDRPDNDFVDSNCDGIDGDPFEAYFVAPGGADEIGRGTLDRPFRTLTYAMQAAAADPFIDSVYVAEGEYTGPRADDGTLSPLELVDGVNIYGGYDAETWRRTADNLTRITGTSPAVIARDLTLPVELARLTIDGIAGVPSEDSMDRSSIGLWAENAAALLLTGCNIRSATAAAGEPGLPGQQGARGSDGDAGNLGAESSSGFCGSAPAPEVGVGGASPCGGRGGDGGTAGRGEGNGGPGQPGGGGVPGAGGPGGGGGDATWTGATDRRGDPGDPGLRGTAGLDANPGEGGLALTGVDGDSWWQTGLGTAGGAGEPGSGGGGGGGGGGAPGGCGDLVNVCDGYGGSGGGGGGGGCGGTPGTPGASGGHSFALYAIDSSIGLQGSSLTTGVAGAGGDGGAGGLGGNGGSGDIGGATECAGGAGGPGGPGARGGSGGAAGGGAGGSSIALVSVRSDVVIDETPLTAGAAGNGGGPPSAAGEAGIRAERYDL